MKSLKITRNFILLFALTASIISFSCKENENTETEQQKEVNTETTTTSNQKNAPAAKMEIPSGDDPNPSHGQPGHRCDIPVGAPLNSKAKNQQARQNTVTGNPIKSSNTNSGKVNPPHGQPGHRCDIPVGASLEGK